MSTIYPFFLMVAAGEWLFPVLNTFGYAVGILCLFALIPFFSKPAIAQVGSSSTIHALIGNLHASPIVRIAASIMTVIAFAGLASFEIVFGARIYRVLFDGNDTVYYVAVGVLTTYLVAYIWFGGQAAGLRTDQWQLALAYIGLHWAGLTLLFSHNVDANALLVPALPAVVTLLTLIAVWWRLKHLKRLRTTGSYPESFWLNVLITLSMLLFAVGVLIKWGTYFDFTLRSPRLPDGRLLPMVISAIALPVLFQFVDITNWQRISSLKSSSTPDLVDEARQGLKQFLIESPATWLLAVVLASLAIQIAPPTAGADPWDAFVSHYVMMGSGAESLAAIFLCVAVVAIFMSTADGLLTAIGWAWAYDVNPATRRIVDAGQAGRKAQIVIDAGRIAIAVSVGLVITLFVMLDILAETGTAVIYLFLSFYTPLIGFTPALLIPAVLGRKAQAKFAAASVILAGCTGLGFGIAATFFRPDWQWYPVPGALIVGLVVYLVGLIVGGHDIPLVREASK